MNYGLIKHTILKVYKDCNIKSFPIDCFNILNTYGIKAYPYDSLPDKLKEYCMRFSEDAINYKDVICYNNHHPTGRIRFSLMHELGHFILKHSQNDNQDIEQQANFFASNILAPRMAIHYAKCDKTSAISVQFGITKEAAQYAYNDYMKWYQRTIKFKMTSFDKALYSHFYNSDAKCFVYNIKKCAYCDNPIYNSISYICDDCKKSNHIYMIYQPPDDDFINAENHWLYGGL